MTKDKTGFSLIEVVVATSILTIGVFGIYKLIGNDLNLVSNTNTKKTANIIEKSLIECIKYFGKDTLSGSYTENQKFSINFGNDSNGCFTGSYDTSYNFSGVLLNNKEFFNILHIQNKETDNININYEIIGEITLKNNLILKQ